MASPQEQQWLYEELADQCDRRRDANQRDAFLVLAADCALTAGHAVEADRLRERLLDVSPHHLLRPFASFSEAMQSSDVREFVEDLRQQFPPQWSETLLASWRREAEANAADSQAPSLLDSLLAGALDRPEPAIAGPSDDPWLISPEPPPIAPLPRMPSVTEPAKPAAPIASPKKNGDGYDLHRTSETPGSARSASKKSKRADRDDDEPPPRKRKKGPKGVGFLGATLIYLLILLVALAGIGLLGYVFARPFLKL